jgi:hypothetical protein
MFSTLSGNMGYDCDEVADVYGLDQVVPGQAIPSRFIPAPQRGGPVLTPFSEVRLRDMDDDSIHWCLQKFGASAAAAAALVRLPPPQAVASVKAALAARFAAAGSVPAAAGLPDPPLPKRKNEQEGIAAAREAVASDVVIGANAQRGLP